MLAPGTVQIQTTEAKRTILIPEPPLDPNHPLNWNALRKTLHLTILCIYTLLVFAILTAATPVWANINAETGISMATLNNAYATGSGSLAIGSIVFLPLAIRFGRRPVYIASSVVMTASSAWFAVMKTSGDAYGANFICGFAGSINEALFQVTVCDLFFVHQRGTMNGIYLVVVTVGNYFGPVAAGYIGVSQDWHWVFWYCTIFMGATTILIIFFLEESKYPSRAINGEVVTRIDIQNDTNIKQVLKDNEALADSTDVSSRDMEPSALDYTIPQKTWRETHALWTTDDTNTPFGPFMFHHISQPFLILVQFPAVAFAALQYGWLVSMLAVLAIEQASIYPYPPYNFSSAGVGNMSIPAAIGGILGTILGGPIVDYFILKIAKRRGGIYKPETRLWLFLVPGLCLPIGSCLFGLTIAQGMPWIINAVGAGFIGFALGGSGDMALTYLQDSYQDIVGDALIGVVFVRNALATAITFAIPPWVASNGVYGMYVTLTVLSTVIVLTCIPFWFFGEKWRAMLAKKYEYFAMRQI